MKRTRLKPVSKKQAKINREIAKINRSLSPYCCICGTHAVDPAHLLPKSIFPQYYTEPWNIVPMCREHHDLYDGNRDYRRSRTELVEIVLQHDVEAANLYFGL